MAWLYTTGSMSLISKPVLVEHRKILKHICTNRNALCDRLLTFESVQHTLMAFSARLWLVSQSEFENQPRFDCEIRPKRFRKDKIEVIRFSCFKTDAHNELPIRWPLRRLIRGELGANEKLTTKHYFEIRLSNDIVNVRIIIFIW